MPKRRHTPQSSSAPAGARSPAGRTWRGPALVLAAALGLGLAGVGAWWLATGRTVRSASGLDLGRLTAGGSVDRLNLLVITLDTTRADRIGAYGYQHIETPAIDRLAREGVLFEQAMATAPLTLPAHCSIFTAKFPPEHGVRDNGGFFLSPDQLTLATLLKRDGFRTGAVVGAYVLDGRWGLNQGFETYVDDFDLSYLEGFALGDVQRPGQRGRGPGAAVAREGQGRAVLRVAALLRRAHAVQGARAVQLALPSSTRTTRRSRSSTRRSRGSWTSSSGTRCSNTRSLPSSATTARGSTSTRRGRTASSSTRAPRACRSSSARRTTRCAAAASPSRSAPWT